jgi:integrase/recombinase XerD
MEWRDEIDRYLEHLTHRNHTPATTKNQRKMLERFFRFAWRQMAERMKTAADVTREVVEAYREHLALEKSPTNGRPYTVATQRHYLHAVKLFYVWLEKEGRVLVSPAEDLELPRKEGRTARSILSEKEMTKLLEGPDISKPMGIRDRALLEVLYSSGLRVKEVERLTIYDVDTAAGLINVRLGKGQKDRIVPLGKTAAHYVVEYLAGARTRYAKKKREATSALFVSTRGDAMNEKAVRGVVYKYAKTAGLKASPHTIRRSTATHMLASGASPEIVGSLLGHASNASLRFYAKLFGPELKEEHKKTHPRETEGAE